jgi:hypothetical protein
MSGYVYNGGLDKELNDKVLSSNLKYFTRSEAVFIFNENKNIKDLKEEKQFKLMIDSKIFTPKLIQKFILLKKLQNY